MVRFRGPVYFLQLFDLTDYSREAWGVLYEVCDGCRGENYFG